MTDTEEGSLKAKSGTSRASFLSYSVGQIKSQGQPRLKGKGNRFHLLMGEAAGTLMARKACWQLFGDILTQLKCWLHGSAYLSNFALPYLCGLGISLYVN